MPLWHKNIKFGITWSFLSNFDILFFLNACFLKTNRMVTITKLYVFSFRFWFLPQFFLRGLTLVVLHVWTQNYLQNVWTCPGSPLQLLIRNNCFLSERPEPPPPPLKLHRKCVSFIIASINTISFINFVISNKAVNFLHWVQEV